MPAYFFHLSFELYPPSHPFSRAIPELSLASKADLTSLPAHIPTGSTSGIFSSSLPRHKPPTPPATDAHIRQKSKSKEPLSLSPTSNRAQFAPSSHPDYRFDRISVESIDMPSKKAQPDGGLVPDAASTAASGVPASKARFVPLETKNTEFGYGVVHLYRDTYETPGLYSSALRSELGQSGDGGSETLGDEALTTVAILAVPSYMTALDFLGFVGEETRDAVSHFRMIRTGKANRYMVLMKFREKTRAAMFMKEFNGKVFNSMEPENCHAVYIKSIDYVSPTTNITPSQPRQDVFPSLTNDPFSPSHSPAPPEPSSSSSAVLSTKPAPPPTPSLLELPTCPVCLERMDETTGLLTILCQHVFHCACLSKWRDSSCPVCRYTQSASPPDLSDDDSDPPYCSVCAADKNLWICLICANVGCGRYDDAHAFQHYKDTAHAYAMDIETQRVWDYVGDNYVHRLIQNKSDGKLVELPPTSSSAEGGDDSVPKEKLESMGMEYTYLLTSQLDSQRTYFERKVAQAADKAAAATAAAEKASSDAAALATQVSALTAQLRELTTDTIPALSRAKDRAEAKATKSAELARSMEKAWKEEKKVTEGLMERIKHLDGKCKEKEQENKDLQEQVRDLMFFVDAREKLKDADEEIKEGSLAVGEAPEKKGKKKRGKR